MARENHSRRIFARSYFAGLTFLAAAGLDLGAWVWMPPVYRLPLSTILLLGLLLVHERQKRAAREKELIEAHAALAETEASFRGVFESSPDILCVHRIEADGTIRLDRFNAAAAASRGFNEASRHKPIAELMPPHVFVTANRAIRQVVSTREAVRLDGDVGRDGPDSEIVIVPLMTDKPEKGVDRVFVSIRDITHLRDAQAAVARSEALYRILAESTNDMITRLSIPDLRRVYVSPACRALLGYEPEELMGKDPRMELHPDDLPHVGPVAHRLAAGELAEAQSPVSYRMRHKAGHWLWVEASISPTRDAAGVVDGVICSIRDISARRRAEVARSASETRFRLLAENASELIVLGHDDGRRSYISPASMRLFGFAPDELERQMQSKKWVHPEDVDYLAGAEFAGEGGDKAVSCRVRHREGHWIWVEAIFRRIQSAGDGEPTIVATFRDVTERQAQAQALREARDAAEVARSAAEQASLAKSNFLATMSHEIRTPLNAILGFTDLLRADASLPKDAQGHLDRVQSAGASLRTVVDDILDFSKLEAGEIRLAPAPFSPARLVEDAARIVEGLAESKKLNLVLSTDPKAPPFVSGDQERLRRILINLLNNAVKFTRQGSITLSLETLALVGGEARLRFGVADTGIGIPADKLSYVFQRFSQVDGSLSREYGGTGLGLAICKSLVDVMGGTIGVESTVEKGSRFWFDLSLPVVEAASVEVATGTMSRFKSGPDSFDELLAVVDLPAWEETASARPVSPVALDILLVEDVVLNQELISTILQMKGHRVDVVGNGSEAIMAVEDKSYDLVLMDLQMPYVDGLTATRIIRNLQAPCRFVPIVALTAAVLQEQAEAALAAGMNAVLTKPVSLPELDAVLDRADRDDVREAVDPLALDEEVVDQLTRAIGQAKVKSMQALLVKSLTARFNMALTEETAAGLKAEAHASIAGAAMLGFVRFGSLCRAFIAAEGDEAARAYGALRRELYQVVRTLEIDFANEVAPNANVRAG